MALLQNKSAASSLQTLGAHQTLQVTLHVSLWLYHGYIIPCVLFRMLPFTWGSHMIIMTKFAHILYIFQCSEPLLDFDIRRLYWKCRHPKTINIYINKISTSGYNIICFLHNSFSLHTAVYMALPLVPFIFILCCTCIVYTQMSFVLWCYFHISCFSRSHAC